MSIRSSIAVLISMMANAVYFGIGTIIVLATPSLAANAAYLLPAVIAISFIAGPITGWVIAPMLRARWQREHAYA